MKINQFKCKWIEPDESAPWEWQSCHCPDKAYGFSVPMISDVSCDHQANSGPRSGMDCQYFEEKEQNV